MNSEALLASNCEIILPQTVITEKLALAQRESRPLIIKLGFDPTSPDLHIGHAVALRKLKQFQDLGHTIVFIIGDFTARIGDPTGKNKTRPPLTEDQINNNAKTYFEQIGKIIDTSRVEVRHNSEWFDKMTPSDFIKLLASVNLGRVMARDDFRKRWDEDSPIGLHELTYPLLQGYDSVMINADIEIGGSDQLFNIQMGRYMQEQRGLEAQGVLCMPLLRGLDGTHKMSKSLNNYIGICDEPRDMFGKMMSVPDTLLKEYIALASSFNEEQQKELIRRLDTGENPINIKKEIAFNLVEQYHSSNSAQEASEFFLHQFQKKTDLEYQPLSLKAHEIFETELPLIDLIFQLHLRESKSETKRLIEQGGVTIDNIKIINPFESITLNPGSTKLTCGKTGFYVLES